MTKYTCTSAQNIIKMLAVMVVILKNFFLTLLLVSAEMLRFKTTMFSLQVIASVLVLVSTTTHAITIMKYEFDNCEGPYTNVTIESGGCYYDGELQGAENPLSYSTAKYDCVMPNGQFVLEASIATQGKCPTRRGKELKYPYELTKKITYKGFPITKRYRHSECVRGGTKEFDDKESTDMFNSGGSIWIDCSAGFQSTMEMMGVVAVALNLWMLSR